MKTTRFAWAVQAEDVMHLSEEQIDEQLMDGLSGEAASHLAECALCSGRVAEVGTPIAHFCEVSGAWAERRSATMPMPSVQGGAVVWQRRVGWAMTACALVVGISFTASERKVEMLRVSTQSLQSVETESVATAQVEVAPAAVARGAEDASAAERYSGDNMMLKTIDSELDASVETPAAMGLETVSQQPRSDGGPSSVQD